MVSKPPNGQIMAEKQRVENSSEEHRHGAKHGRIGWPALRDDPQNHHKLGSNVEYCLQQDVNEDLQLRATK